MTTAQHLLVPSIIRRISAQHLLLGRRLGARSAAADAYLRAIELAGNATEREFLQRRLAQTRG